MTKTTERTSGARTYVTSPSGVKITVHKSVRNNWKTTVCRDGKQNETIVHDSRKLALASARAVK